MDLARCMASGCINFTTNNLKKYETYCFLHSNATHKPYTLKELKIKNLDATLASRDILLPTVGLQKPIILEKVRKEKTTVSPNRKAPLPIRKMMGSAEPKYGEYDTITCCVCDTLYEDRNKMKCGHLVCETCLDYLRSVDCPACGQLMVGNFITPEILAELNKRQKEDLVSLTSTDL